MAQQKKEWTLKKKIVVASIASFIAFSALIASVPEEQINNKEETQQQTTSQTNNNQDPETLNVVISHDNLNIAIMNKETKHLGNCRLTLNENYSYDASGRYLVNAGEEIKIGFSEFTKKDGTRFNSYLIKPQYLAMRCDRKDGNYGAADVFWN